MENSNDTGKAIGALAVAALLGAAAGVLFAPNKGSKTRAMLAGGARHMADDISDKVNSEAHLLKDAVTELKNLAEERVNDLVSTAKGKNEKVHLS